MSQNGHKTASDKIIETLKLNDGRLSLWQLLELARVRRDDVDDLLEQAASPISVRIVRNGNPKPATIILLKGYEPPKPKTQAQVAETLNSMSNAEFYALCDPTYAIRRSSHGRHRRTSTGADEYLKHGGRIR
jgi:hypothetical protein